MKNKHTLSFVALLGALLLSPAAMAQSRSLVLNDASPSDLRPAQLVAAPAMPLANENRETVTFSWLASGAKQAQTSTEPFVATSREFHRTVDASALTQGLEITTGGKGAVIRLSSPERGVTLDPDRLSLTFGDGQRLTARAASNQLVNGDDLRAAGMATPSATLGLRLAPEFGSGRMTLRYDADLPAKAPITVWVLDRNSDTVLSVQSTADHFTGFGEARAEVELSSGASGRRQYTMSGSAMAPDGTSYALRIDGRGEARFADPDAAAWLPGLWEWHFRARTDSGIERMVKTAFAFGLPVARFDSSAVVQTDGDTMQIALGAEVKSAGRYEARATLYATNREGQQVAAMVGAVAGWLEAGNGVLTVQFGAKALKDRGLGAPFELRDLTLTDQSRMTILERRANALVF